MKELKEEFKELYYNQGLPLRVVAKELNTSHNNLRYYMNTHWNLKSRSKSDSLKLAHTEGRINVNGIKNPNYKHGKLVDAGVGKRWSKYGITENDFNIMLENQDNKCKICLDDFVETPHIDHCHTLGNVRGLLCRGCNRGIGFLNDDVKILENAIKYLTKARWDNSSLFNF